jgi:hypothetical protein
VTLGRSCVVAHLLAQLFADQDRRVHCLDRAGEHELPTGNRVVPGRDAELVGGTPLTNAGQIVGRRLPACHNGSVDHTNGQSDEQRSLESIFADPLRWREVVRRQGLEPRTR